MLYVRPTVRVKSVHSSSRPLERLEAAWSHISHTGGKKPFLEVSLAHVLAGLISTRVGPLLTRAGMELQGIGWHGADSRGGTGASKVQEVIFRAIGKKIPCWRAAEILGIAERTMRRWKLGCEKYGILFILNSRIGENTLDIESNPGSCDSPPVSSSRVCSCRHATDQLPPT
jgi:hypothetical protein